ncbi:SAM-dependent methyltransferase [Streptacidiphilus carbonis]|uniref:SAM-dependent methyltransferase n=1 Tax=Streptacidiphilus carbonis TaxID=105422 RepID=UPI0005AB425D|nr:SAM-dependent methyltransferase [Streptacidiphilus carbonis]
MSHDSSRLDRSPHRPPVPPGVDLSRAHPARMYDYYLHGRDNFPIDREEADRVLRGFPDLRTSVLEGRAFLGRAVGYLLEDAGIDQFLDIGAGLLQGGSTHEIARGLGRQVRVVYVDNDPVVVSHAHSMIDGVTENRTAYTCGDLRDPLAVLQQVRGTQVLDLDRPVGLVLSGVLHFVADDERPHEIVDFLLAALAPGSYLLVSHATGDHSPHSPTALEAAYRQSGTARHVRSRCEVQRFFARTEPVPPGVVDLSHWQTDHLPQPRPALGAVACYGAVGRRT